MPLSTLLKPDHPQVLSNMILRIKIRRKTRNSRHRGSSRSGRHDIQQQALSLSLLFLEGGVRASEPAGLRA